MKPRWIQLGTAMSCAVILSVAAAGCSGSTGSSSASDTSQEQTLTVASPTIDPLFAQTYLALSLGYFKDAGVKVTITDAAANVLTDVVSGQADIGSGAPSIPLAAVKNGANLQVIYGSVTGNGSSFVASPSSVKSLTQCKSFGAGAVGAQTYIQAEFFKQKSGASYNVTPFSSYPTEIASLLSGRVDCAIGTYGFFATPISEGKLHLLVDPRDPSLMPKGSSTTGLPVGTVWATKSTLETKKTAIIEFLRAEQRALTYLRATSPQTIAADLVKLPEFAQTSSASIASQVAALQQAQVYAPNDGYISAANWNATLSYLSSAGGANYDPSVSAYSYDARVDMSLLNQADKS